MSELPEQVLEVKKEILENPEDPLNSIIEQLTQDDPEIHSMWKSLETRRIGEDRLWVWGFLHAVQSAKELPRFHNKSAKERRDLIESINDHCDQLKKLLKANDLDGHIVQLDGKNFNGFYIYEDFSWKIQSGIDEEGLKKMNVGIFLETLAERCKEKIEGDTIPGKAGKNAPAIRFIRLLADRNCRLLGTPLNSVLAIAANTFYDTNYSESDIAKILNR